MNSYEFLIFKKHPKYLYMWLITIFILLLSFLGMGIFYKYSKFYEINGLVIKEGSDNYVQILVSLDKLDIIKTNHLIIDNEIINYKYEVDNQFYSESNQIFRQVRLQFNNNYNNGELITLSFKSPVTTFLKEIKNKIKKGMI